MPAHPAEVEVVKSACIDLFKASAGQYLGHVHNNAPLFHPLLREQRSRILSARGEAPRPRPHVPMRLLERRGDGWDGNGMGGGLVDVVVEGDHESQQWKSAFKPIPP